MPKPLRRAGAKIFHEHIGVFEQLKANFFALRRFEIEHQAFFVAIEMGEIETKQRIGRKVAIRIALRRRLDLDHPRAEIGQQRRRVRAGDESRAFDDRDIVENFDGHEFVPALIFHGLARHATRRRRIFLTISETESDYQLRTLPELAGMAELPPGTAIHRKQFR